MGDHGVGLLGMVVLDSESVEKESHRQFIDLLGDCCFEDQYLNAGEVLFREGDPGGTFYIVRGGRLRAVKGLGTMEARTLGEIGHDYWKWAQSSDLSNLIKIGRKCSTVERDWSRLLEMVAIEPLIELDQN